MNLFSFYIPKSVLNNQTLTTVNFYLRSKNISRMILFGLITQIQFA